MSEVRGVSRPSPLPRPSRRVWAIVALTLFLLTVAASLAWVRWNRAGDPLGVLTATLPTESRSFEPRLSGGFAWAPLVTARRGAGHDLPADATVAARRILRDSDALSSGEARHASAVANLLLDEPARALATLAAAPDEQKTPALWNDLAAAHYAMALRTDSSEQLSRALASVDRSLQSAVSQEALFNRALILERFHLRDAATAAWRDFLLREPSGGWRDEAQHHLDALAAPQPTATAELERQWGRLQSGDAQAARGILAIDAGEARYFAETDGFARWGEASLRGDGALAEKHLRALRTLGAALVAFNGETLVRDTVSFLDRAEGDRRTLLAGAHIAFRDGRRIFKERRQREAEQLLTRAADDLSRGGSPLSAEVRLFAAIATFNQNRHAEAEQIFRALDRSVVDPGHSALRGYVDWMLASCLMTRAENGPTLETLERAIATFERLREHGNAAYLHDITAEVYDGIRDDERAERHRLLALRELGRISDYRLEHAISGMVYAALQRKDWYAAQSLLTVELSVSEKVGDHELRTMALLRRALLRSQLGDASGVSTDLRDARATLMSVSDLALRGKLQADFDAATALVSNDPRVAIPLLTNALRYQAEHGWQRLMPDLYLRRGRMYLAANDHRRAAADFETGIAVLEAHRHSLPKGEQRWSILDAGDELFDEAISEALRSSADAAFAYAERKRARSLADDWPRSDASLPAGTVLIEYAALPERLIVFTVDQSGTRAAEVRMPRDELATLVTTFMKELRGGGAAVRSETGGRIFDTLIAPVRPAMNGREHVVFVTDAFTASIAFAAIPDGATRLPLVQQFNISVAPSARQYLRARRPARPRSSILIVDSPVNDAVRALPAAAAEAREIAGQYARPRRLRGAGATRAAFVREAADAEVIHFAGHGIAGSASASLVLTPTAEDSGFFDAPAISRLALPRVDVVVLAACDTARGPVKSAEGTLSVAYAFLQAGAPAVIATLWPIADAEAAVFFPRLHAQLARGLPPSEALRLAQLEFLRDPVRHPSAFWAAMQVIGY